MYDSKTINSCQDGVFVDYLRDMQKSLDFFKPLFKKIKLRSLYVGGGTPSLMGEAQIASLLDNVFSSYSFNKNAEKAFENSPGTCTKEKIRIYRAFGINRISLGVQSLQPEVLERNNRRFSSFNEIRELVDFSKETGIGFVNVDLMAGIEGQSPDFLINDFLKIWNGTKTDSVTVYIQRILQNNTGSGSGGTDGAAAKRAETIKRLRSAGEKQVEALYRVYSKNNYLVKEDNHFIRNYSKELLRYKTRSIYEKNVSTIGMGYGAFSFILSRFHFLQGRSGSFADWFRGGKNFRIAEYSDKEQRAYYITDRLYASNRISFNGYESFFGDKFEEKHKKIIDFLLRKKFIILTGQELILTASGIERKHLIQYLFYPRKNLLKIIG